MDLDAPVVYRGFDLNSVEVQPGTGRRRGVLIEEADFGNVAGIGYTEKRSQDDGLDSSDVYLGPRRVSLRGYIYGWSQGEALDILQQLRSVFTPTAAYAENPFDKGYLPLVFSAPTEDLVNFPLGVKNLEMRLRPRAQPEFALRRDTGSGRGINGADSGSAITWAQLLEAKDPRIYIAGTPTAEYFTATESGTLENRGDYPSPLDVFLEVPVASAAGTVVIEVGGQALTITVPDSTAIQYIRYSGEMKVLTVESNSIEVLRMDLMKLSNEGQYPQVPPYPSPYTVTVTGCTLTNTSRLFYSEAFA